jgi:hypothetical protein
MMKVRITLNEEALGMTPAKEDIHRDYIASKAPDAATMEEEVAERGVEEVDKNTTTIFPKLANGTPFLYDYQIKGFFKDTCQMLARAGKSGYEGGKACSAVKAYKKCIDGNLFVKPRKIPFDMHGLMMDTCSRPLRAMTMQGERVSIAKSETVPEGSTLEFEIILLDSKLEDMVVECLNYGELRGLGQWRNSGKGVFNWDLLDDNGNVIGGNNENH